MYNELIISHTEHVNLENWKLNFLVSILLFLFFKKKLKLKTGNKKG